MIKPDYYKGQDGKDLFDRFEDGLLTVDEVRGFYKGNVIKYVTRYQDKNGIEDLEKAQTYLERLKKFDNKVLHLDCDEAVFTKDGFIKVKDKLDDLCKKGGK